MSFRLPVPRYNHNEPKRVYRRRPVRLTSKVRTAKKCY
jgi:hypothetical protein